jgi:uncharacterized protein YkwD
MARDDSPESSQKLPAVIVGVLIGVAIVSGVSTAPWWGARTGLVSETGQRTRAVGRVLPCKAGGTCLAPQELPGEQQQLIAWVTGERARAGCRDVRLDSRLQQAAQNRVGEIAAGSRPSHIDAGQRTPQDRAEAAGFHGRVLENLAVGLKSPDEVIDLWLDDKVDLSLRTRLDNCAVIAIGLGYSPKRADSAYGPGIWVLLLGQPETG